MGGVRTRVRARFLVGHDGRDHVVHRNGEMVYEKGQILHVGGPFDGRVDIEIDEGDALVGPGFVDLDALGDIDHAVFDTFQGPELAKGLIWSWEYASEPREVFTAEERAIIREWAFGQLLLNGITTAMPISSETYMEWAETRDELTVAADVAAQLGLRAYLGPSYRASVPVIKSGGDFSQLENVPLGESGLDAAIGFADEIDGAHGGLIRAALFPSRIENQTTAILQRSKRASDLGGWPLRLHAGQTLSEVKIIQERHGLRPIEYLDSIGFLGDWTSIPHAWALDSHSQMGENGTADLDRLASSGATVIFCPVAEARYGVFPESFDRYFRHGINMAMGTDTAPPDMIRAMDTGMVITKAVERRKDSGDIGNLYRAATVGGAEALGRGDLGRLAPGARADWITVALDNPRFGPVDDPIRSLVMNGDGRDVRRVVVDGRVVVADGALVGANMPALRSVAQDLHDKYRRSYSERDWCHRSADVLFPDSFRTENHGG